MKWLQRCHSNTLSFTGLHFGGNQKAVLGATAANIREKSHPDLSRWDSRLVWHFFHSSFSRPCVFKVIQHCKQSISIPLKLLFIVSRGRSNIWKWGWKHKGDLGKPVSEQLSHLLGAQFQSENGVCFPTHCAFISISLRQGKTIMSTPHLASKKRQKARTLSKVINMYYTHRHNIPRRSIKDFKDRKVL